MKILSNCPEYKECPAYELCFEETTSCEIRSNYIRLKTVKAVFEAMDKILRQTEYQGVFSCWESNYEALKKQLQAKNG